MTAPTTASPATLPHSATAAGTASGVRTRFAPSPTGRLHVGHGWSALMAMDLARVAGGTMRLRIEDIDGTRSRPEHVAAIIEDLRWLGVAWDGEIALQRRAPVIRLGTADLTLPLPSTYPRHMRRWWKGGGDTTKKTVR